VKLLDDPTDSLQHYLDDLLNGDDFAYLEPNSVLPALESKKIDVENVKQNLVPEISLSETKITEGDSQQLAASSLPRSTFFEPTFADPDLAQKEKLQKLLHSTPTAIETVADIKSEKLPEVLSISEPHKYAAEIQDWDLKIEEARREETIVEETIVQETIVQETRIEKARLEQPIQPSGEEVGASVILAPEEPPPLEDCFIPELEWMPNGLPKWAQSRFDVLLFQVSGLTLAVPLISLGQILPMSDTLTPLFGQADWFMGLQQTPIGKIRVVNTAKFVMPERYHADFVKNAKYVVSINGVPWGLAVDSVNQPISLEPHAVKWRTNRSQRPWLAGTVKEHMCALLDIPVFGKLLMFIDKNRVKSRS
jgi:purine-binding chemotaxis protein CheW